MSSLLAIWSVAAFVLEVPSGALADRIDRRTTLLLSAGGQVAAFSCWMIWPSYPGFALGFILWGASGALMSGAFEALVYDELAAMSATEAYAGLIGWVASVRIAAVMVGMASAGPLYDVGGYLLVGWISVGIATLHGILTLLLPKAPKAITESGDAGTDPAGYLSLLRSGLVEAATHPPVRRAVLYASAFGVLAIDEYFPLLARDTGVSMATVPWLVALTMVGPMIGTALAGRSAALSRRTLNAMVVVAVILLAAGALSGTVGGFVALSAGYGLAWNVATVADARVQHVIEGPARATVTSLVGLTAEVWALASFAVIGVGSAWWSLTSLVAVLCLPLLSVVLISAGRAAAPSRTAHTAPADPVR